jgi:hypothetical protein
MFADWMRDVALPDMSVVVLLLSLGMLKIAVLISDRCFSGDENDR